jgi:hypothetical protein
MAKLTAWLVTVVGVLLILPLIGVDLDTIIVAGFTQWIIALAVLIVGIGKLVRNYSNKKRR